MNQPARVTESEDLEDSAGTGEPVHGPVRMFDLWCRGQRLTGEKPLTDHERGWIKGLRFAHRRRMALGAMLLPAVLAVPFVAMSLPPWRAGGAVTAGLALWVILALFVVLPVALLLVRDHWRAARDMSADLARGTLWEFEAPMPTARHEPDGDSPRKPVAPVMRLLQGARRRVDLQAHDPDIARENVIEVDPHSGTGMYAPLSLRLTSSAPGVEFEQRPMSGSERVELDNLRRKLVLPRPGTALAVIGFVALFSILRFALERLAAGEPARWDGLLSAVLVMAICVRELVRYTRSVLLSGRIRADLAIGLVVRIEGAEVEDAEMLPFSRLFWRVAGAPAGWRDRHRGPDTLRANL